MEKQGKKQAKTTTTTAVQKAGKSSDRKPRSVSKADGKKGSNASKSKSAVRGSSSAKKDGKGTSGKSRDRRSSSKNKKTSSDTGKQSKLQDKKKGKKDEAKEEEDDEPVMKPTRAISGYIFFSNEMVPKIKVDEGIPHKQAMSRAGEIWKGYSDEEKKKYEKMHEKDQERYEKQLKDLKDKGYFMMSDGTKSTDHEVPNKKKRAKSTDKKRGKSSTGKRKSVMDKSTDKGKKGKGIAASGKKSTKKSDDEDLDIESGSGNDDDSVENSA
eukprot:403348940